MSCFGEFLVFNAKPLKSVHALLSKEMIWVASASLSPVTECEVSFLRRAKSVDHVNESKS